VLSWPHNDIKLKQKFLFHSADGCTSRTCKPRSTQGQVKHHFKVTEERLKCNERARATRSEHKTAHGYGYSLLMMRS